MKRPAARGLTLLELLVTLVITALAAGLVGQALWQLVRVEAMLEQQSALGAARTVREQWLRGALSAAQPATPDRSPAVQGDARALELVTADPIALAGQAYGRMRLVLRALPDGTTVLDVEPLGQGAPGTVAGPGGAVRLLSWPVREARWHYLDHEGRWLAQWPPPGITEPRTPRALRLELVQAPEQGLVVFNPTYPVPLVSRRQAEDG